jgi:hypothetical protein
MLGKKESFMSGLLGNGIGISIICIAFPCPSVMGREICPTRKYQKLEIIIKGLLNY